MFADRPVPLAGLRCLWATNEGAAVITHNSILTLLEVAPDLADNVAIGCIDAASLTYFARNLPTANLLDLSTDQAWTDFSRSQTEGGYGDYGSQRFRDASFARYFALMRLMEQKDSPVLYIDGDIAFPSDPRPHLARAAAAPNAAVLIQSDLSLRPDSRHDETGRIIRDPGAWRNYCSGLVCWSGADRAKELSLRIIGGLDRSVENSHDQHVLNSFPYDDLQDLVILPEEVFPNGSYLFEYNGELKFSTEETKARLAKACVVHANWMIGMQTKINALEKVGLWRLGSAGRPKFRTARRIAIAMRKLIGAALRKLRMR